MKKVSTILIYNNFNTIIDKRINELKQTQVKIKPQAIVV
jgi:hypothetical protein